jgi:hypothetical protein
MLETLKLLLPALIPSWRFFDGVAPSPRIEFALLNSEMEMAEDWREFRPRPEKLNLASMMGRMIWNPRWNESLFLVSCAERLMDHPTEHSRREIIARIQAELKRKGVDAPLVQFRLVFLSRQEAEIVREITYTSPVYPS